MIPAKAFILIGGKSKRFGSPKWKVVIDGKEVNVTRDHIKISRRTMFEEEYYLDKGEFIVQS